MEGGNRIVCCPFHILSMLDACIDGWVGIGRHGAPHQCGMVCFVDMALNRQELQKVPSHLRSSHNIYPVTLVKQSFPPSHFKAMTSSGETWGLLMLIAGRPISFFFYPSCMPRQHMIDNRSRIIPVGTGKGEENRPKKKGSYMWVKFKPTFPHLRG